MDLLVLYKVEDFLNRWISFSRTTLFRGDKNEITVTLPENRNYASCAVWVRNLVSHFEGGTQTEGFCEHSVEEGVWT
jgi:hypothetical protein